MNRRLALWPPPTGDYPASPASAWRLGDPEATNLVTAAAYAQLGAMPLLMITGQRPSKTSKQGRFQIVDVVDMMRPLTKFVRQIVGAGSIPALVREAFRIAQQERPGAVHLELREDIGAERKALAQVGGGLGELRQARDRAITQVFKAVYEPGSATSSKDKGTK